MAKDNWPRRDSPLKKTSGTTAHGSDRERERESETAAAAADLLSRDSNNVTEAAKHRVAVDDEEADSLQQPPKPRTWKPDLSEGWPQTAEGLEYSKSLSLVRPDAIRARHKTIGHRAAPRPTTEGWMIATTRSRRPLTERAHTGVMIRAKKDGCR